MDKEMKELFKKCNISEINIKDNNLEVSLPENTYITLINNNNYEKEKIGEILDKYNSLLDIFPIRITYKNNIEVLDIYNQLLLLHIVIINKTNFIILFF